MDREDYRRPRLEFLDGLRGLLAIQVLLVHANYFFYLPMLVNAMALGSYRVAAFITISGFVLYLPSASEDEVMMKRPALEYLKRRAYRLLPAWYASLLLTFLVMGCVSYFGLRGGSSFSDNWVSLLWHGSFLHSWNPQHRYSLNSALWFMGFELQLSLLFPLLLVLVRKCGWLLLFGLAIALTLPLPGRMGELFRFLFSPDLTFPFVLGMFAARVARRPDLFFRGRSDRLIGVSLLLVFCLSVLAHLWSVAHQRGIISACTASLGVAALAIYLTYFSGNWIERVLSVRWLKFLGTFSYSIFLIHMPLLTLIVSLTSGFGPSGASRFYFVFLPAALLIVAVSYAFHLVFERPLSQSAQQQ